ncbi:MAG TPA: hypothetical protein VGV38_06655 [Pyrinomonadaceae bacterium]|nr:hypothetical protein [Pyrinomonadaceae bacterium]
MGGVTNMITGMLQRAKQDANFRRSLEDDPRGVLDRETGRKLSDEEFEAALAKLKRNGVNAKTTRS